VKKITIILTTLSIVFAVQVGTAQELVWQKQFGGPERDDVQSMTVDVSGNVYTTGYFLGTVDFDPNSGVSNLTSAGIGDIFINKLDASGNFLWAKQLGGSSHDIGESITVDASGNVYITGTFLGTADFDPGSGTVNFTTSATATDFFICKLDPSGNFVWAKQFPGSGNDVGSAIAVDASGNVYTTGYFTYTIDFDPGAGVTNLSAFTGSSIGSSDIFISKLDSSGNFVWAKRLGGSNSDYALNLCTDNLGNVYTTGIFGGTVDFDPGIGIKNLTSSDYDDIFISKLDASGNFVWAKQLSASSAIDLSSITVDVLGNVYTTGYFQGTADFDLGSGTVFFTTSVSNSDIFISKLDASGNFVWAKQLGERSSTDAGKSITVDASGNVYTTGYFSGTVDFDSGAGVANLTSQGSSTDIFINKLDASGNFVWAKKMGNSDIDAGISIKVDAFGNVYTSGYFNGTGSRDIFVLKLSQTVLGIEESAFETESKLYPNPTQGKLTIDLKESTSKIQVVVRNPLGIEIIRKIYPEASSIQLDLEGEVGIYFVELLENNKKTMLKVVKN
jgi:hypothetical protein